MGPDFTRDATQVPAYLTWTFPAERGPSWPRVPGGRILLGPLGERVGSAAALQRLLLGTAFGGSSAGPIASVGLLLIVTTRDNSG